MKKNKGYKTQFYTALMNSPYKKDDFILVEGRDYLQAKNLIVKIIGNYFCEITEHHNYDDALKYLKSIMGSLPISVIVIMLDPVLGCDSGRRNVISLKKEA